MLAGDIYSKADNFSLLLTRMLLDTLPGFGHCILGKVLINWKEISRSSENRVREKELGRRLIELGLLKLEQWR